MRRCRLPGWARIAVLYVATLGVLYPCEYLNLPGVEIAPYWPPSGVALAGLIVFGRSAWPGVALAALTSGVWDTPSKAVFQALTMTTESVAAAWLLERVGFDPRLARRQDVSRLLLYGAAFPAVIGGLVYGIGLLATGQIELAKFPASFLVLWGGDTLGIIVVTPCLVSAATSRPFLARGRRLEALAVAVTIAAAGTMVFMPLLVGISLLPATFSFLPLVLWAAFRLGPAATAAAVVEVSAFAAIGTVLGHGPFAVGPPLAQWAYVQTFLLVTALVGLYLAAAEREREAALHRRAEFLSIASHELKTPLTPLRVGLQLMMSQPERAPALAARSMRQLDRLAGLVDTLLDVSRLGHGALAIRREEVDLGVLAREAAARHEATARAARCRLEVHAEEGLVGRWDRRRLEQVVDALLANACKYAAGTEIELEVHRHDDRARLVVQDRGAGIPPDDLDRIFLEFERGRTDRALGGLGLGLYLSRQLVEAHGGTLSAGTRPGGGARFVADLPYTPPAARHRARPTSWAFRRQVVRP